MAARYSPTALLAALGFAALGFATTPKPACAEEPEPSVETVRAPTAEILESLDRPEDESGWLSMHLDRMNVHEKYGLTYTRRLDARDKPMTFSVRGPILGKGLSKRRRIGLSIKIRF